MAHLRRMFNWPMSVFNSVELWNIWGVNWKRERKRKRKPMKVEDDGCLQIPWTRLEVTLHVPHIPSSKKSHCGLCACSLNKKVWAAHLAQQCSLVTSRWEYRIATDIFYLANSEPKASEPQINGSKEAVFWRHYFPLITSHVRFLNPATGELIVNISFNLKTEIMTYKMKGTNS